MNAPTFAVPFAHVPQIGRGVLRLTDVLRDEAALELGDVLDGVSGKAVRRADVPGAGVTFLSRSKSGDTCNPLYRIVAVFVMMRRLGLSKWRAQRIIDWLQEIVDVIWADEDAPKVEGTNDETPPARER